MPVYVAGYGFTKVKEHWNSSLEELAVDACLEAVDMAGVSLKNIDKIIVANALGEYLNRKGHLGALIADSLGVLNKTAVRIEAGGASGGMVIHQAFVELKAGEANNILVCGVEKMSDALPSAVYTARALMIDRQYLSAIGATLEALEAILLRLYLDRYKAEHDNIMNLAVISHGNAVNAKHAQFPRAITIETVKKSPYVADPLHLFEVTAPADGAAALLLSNSSGEAEIIASSAASDRFRFFERDDPLWLESVYSAVQSAYAQAKLTHDDIDFIELHDVSTIMGVLELEALSFADKGTGHKLIGDKFGDLSSEKPINTFGGLKARGDPIGATGIYQVAEIAAQLLNQADKNQLDNARTGLALSLSGLGELSVINILRKK